MKLHFDEIFIQKDHQIIPNVDVAVGTVTYPGQVGFPENYLLFGVSYLRLTDKVFEVEGIPNGGYEIRAYYVS